MNPSQPSSSDLEGEVELKISSHLNSRYTLHIKLGSQKTRIGYGQKYNAAFIHCEERHASPMLQTPFTQSVMQCEFTRHRRPLRQPKRREISIEFVATSMDNLLQQWSGQYGPNHAVRFV
jgi:hypothetical protein